jgi:SARP family transcriptional regulator, regulator of embCAB operon
VSTRIHLCGAVTVAIKGRRAEAVLPGRQGVALLAFLVLHRDRPSSRDALADALWPSTLPGAPGPALRALLSKLRRALGPGTLLGRDPIQLVLAPDAWVDVEVATEAVHRAEAAVAADAWPEAWGASRVARSIADRTLLPGHDLPWIDERRRELALVGERADRCVAVCGLALGGQELAAAERAARRLVERNPLDESAAVLFMRALAARGDTGTALLEFDRLRLRLRERLGAAPGPEAQALHRSLLGAA